MRGGGDDRLRFHAEQLLSGAARFQPDAAPRTRRIPGTILLAAAASSRRPTTRQMAAAGVVAATVTAQHRRGRRRRRRSVSADKSTRQATDGHLSLLRLGTRMYGRVVPLVVVVSRQRRLRFVVHWHGFGAGRLDDEISRERDETSGAVFVVGGDVVVIVEARVRAVLVATSGQVRTLLYAHFR